MRRTRTVQRQLAGVFPPTELPGFRAEFRWLQQATGPARDLDVYLEELDSLREMLPESRRGDLDPLVPVLAHSRLAARADMTRALRSVRAANLFEDWDRLLETLVELPLEDRPDAERPLGAVSGKRVHKVYKRIVRMGRAIDEGSPPEAYHELRKKAKELRYLLELFGVKLFDEEAVTPFVKSLKGLQDVLGRHQDREVQIAMLGSQRSGGGRSAGRRGRLHGHGHAGGAPARRRAGGTRRVRGRASPIWPPSTSAHWFVRHLSRRGGRCPGSDLKRPPQRDTPVSV